MSSTKTRRFSHSRSSLTSTGRRLTDILLKNSFSMSNTRRSSLGSITTTTTTTRTGSILSDLNGLGEHDYEMNRQIMQDLIKEIQTKKSCINFHETFLEQDDVIGCLLRIFLSYAEDVHGIERISRENMLKLLTNSEMFDEDYTPASFANDWNDLRKEMIKKKIYERKMKTFDFCGFIQLIDRIKIRLNQSKDEILKRIIGQQVYNDIHKLKEIRDKIRLGLLPSMSTLFELYDDIQMKMNDQRKLKKKKKKRSKKRRKKKIKTIQQNDSLPPQLPEEKSSITKILMKLEPWIKRDELDKDLMNKLSDLFQLASLQFQPGLIRENVFIQWLRVSQIIPDTYSVNLIEGVLSNVLARYINENIYKLGTDTFEWNGFMECIQILAREIHLPLNEFVKRLLIADEMSFRQWQTETELIPEVGTHTKVNRVWDAKKVLAAVNLMREIVDESRKLHLTDDERKRLRSLYKEFATFAYRRQSSHLEARLTNSVLSNWMRECRILDDKYTINELDKDFISILGDFTLNGLYPQGTRDIDFDGFLVLIQTIAAHKHIRADHLLQMIFAGPRSPLQKTSEFNEHMDRTKIQTSQGV